MPPRKKRKKAQGAKRKKPANPSPATEAADAPQPGEKLSDHPVGALVPQPHGGALRNGGTNKGGPGRPPEILRNRSRDVFEKWLAWADTVMDQAIAAQQPAPEGEKKNGKPAKVPDETAVLSIGKTAGRFGFPLEDMVSRQWVREQLQKQVEVLTNIFPPAEAERALAALSNLWHS